MGAETAPPMGIRVKMGQYEATKALLKLRLAKLIKNQTILELNWDNLTLIPMASKMSFFPKGRGQILPALWEL